MSPLSPIKNVPFVPQERPLCPPKSLRFVLCGIIAKFTAFFFTQKPRQIRM